MIRTRLLPAAALAAALVLTGCGGDPEPQIADPTPTAPTASVSSQTARTVEERTIRDFVQLISESIGTGDPQPWLDLTSDCTQCGTIADNLRIAYRDGGRIEGGLWQVSALEAAGQVELGTEWLLTVETAEETWLDGQGRVAKTVRASTQQFALAVEFKAASESAFITGLRTQS